MAKSSSNKFIDTIDECVTNGVNHGIFHVSIQDESLNGRHITINDRKVVNFGSCSYLGLEVDERLKQGAIDATIRYGTQYSASRAFSACPLYEEVEDLFYKIFDNNHAILGATTTLTHIAAIPILVGDQDLVIIDHQVHGSVQTAVQLAKAKGTRVEMIRHNRLDILEDLIKENPNRYSKIWYMADGLYSMYGDYAPVDELNFLLEKYSNFHVYYDDAHGMSWAGKHGNGYILSKTKLHPKVVLSTSLAKGFGAGGGVLVLSDGELKRKILSCGTSYTLSGPLQPPILGAIAASAKIHLSDEIYDLQHTLDEKIKLAHHYINEYALPAVRPAHSPIIYLGLGLPRIGYNMARRLMNDGFYANIGIFPAVPVKCTGLRLPLTNGQTNEDIKNIMEAFSYHLPKVMEEENFSIEQISRSFHEPFEETKRRYSSEKKAEEQTLSLQYETSINKIDQSLWNELLGDHGVFDWEGCRFLEDTFRNNEEIENNWYQHYLIIRDSSNKPVLATFFTETLIKDDLIAPANVSKQVEVLREKDKYHLTSKVLMMGSLISVGNHLYVDKKHPQWKDAMQMMLQLANDIKQNKGLSAIQLRDLYSDDLELRDLLIAEGFIKVAMPDVHTLFGADWNDEAEYLSRFSSGSRWNFKKLILDKRDNFEVTILQGKDKQNANLEKWFDLYFNVKRKSFNINTYTLPKKYFNNLLTSPHWEVIELRLKQKENEPPVSTEVVSVGFCFRSSGNNYSFMAVGLDYDYVVTHGAYRQMLYHAVLRANELKCNKLYLGMDASVEKKRFGTTVIEKSVYVQADDNFNMELMGVMQAGDKREQLQSTKA